MIQESVRLRVVAGELVAWVLVFDVSSVAVGLLVCGVGALRVAVVRVDLALNVKELPPFEC